MEYLKNLQYNSIVILSYFFISFLILWLGKITNKKSNKFFSSGRGFFLNPMIYIKMFYYE